MTAASSSEPLKLYSQLKVNQLRSLLKSKNLSATGNKEALQNRLYNCLIDEGHDPSLYCFDESLNGSYTESATADTLNVTNIDDSAIDAKETEGAVNSSGAIPDKQTEGVDLPLNVEDEPCKNIEAKSDKKKDNDSKTLMENKKSKNDHINEPTDDHFISENDKGSEIIPKSNDFIDLSVIECENKTAVSLNESTNEIEIKHKELSKSDSNTISNSENKEKNNGTCDLTEKDKSCVVWFSKIPSSTKAKDLNELCQKEGRRVSKIKVLESNSGSNKVAYAIFKHADMAKGAVEYFSKNKLNGKLVDACIATEEIMNKIKNPRSSSNKSNSPVDKSSANKNKSQKNSQKSIYAQKISKNTSRKSKSQNNGSNKNSKSYANSQSSSRHDSRSDSYSKRPLINYNRYEDSRNGYSSSDKMSSNYVQDGYLKSARDSYRSADYKDSKSLLGDQPYSRSDYRSLESRNNNSYSKSTGLLSTPYSQNYKDSGNFNASKYDSQYSTSSSYQYPYSSHLKSDSHSPKDRYSRNSPHNSYDSDRYRDSDPKSRKNDEIEMLKREISDLKSKIERDRGAPSVKSEKYDYRPDSYRDGQYSRNSNHREFSDYRQPDSSMRRDYPPSKNNDNFYSDSRNFSPLPRDKSSYEHSYRMHQNDRDFLSNSNRDGRYQETSDFNRLVNSIKSSSDSYKYETAYNSGDFNRPLNPEKGHYSQNYNDSVKFNQMPSINRPSGNPSNIDYSLNSFRSKYEQKPNSSDDYMNQQYNSNTSQHQQSNLPIYGNSNDGGHSGPISQNSSRYGVNNSQSRYNSQYSPQKKPTSTSDLWVNPLAKDFSKKNTSLLSNNQNSKNTSALQSIGRYFSKQQSNSDSFTNSTLPNYYK